jgi:TolB protein
VLGENGGWPALDSYLYAETSPVWFGEPGSTDPDAARESARTLLMLLDVAEENMRAAYGNAPIPNLLEHFGNARRKLEALAD